MRPDDASRPDPARRRLLRAAALAAAAAPLSACGGLQTLTTATRPIELYSLTPKSSFDPDLPQVRAQLVVEEPTADASVNTDRIAVKPHALRVQYFPEARWVERAPLLVQRMLMESFENSSKLDAVGRSAVGLRADYVLVVDLREFQAVESEAGPEAPVRVYVRMNMKIVAQPAGRIVGSRSFGQVARAASNEMLDVVSAFDEALGRTMRKTVEWSLRRVGDIEKQRRARGPEPRRY